jgi:hypothetical protein
MKKILNGQRFNCEIIFAADLPLKNRKKFVRDAKKQGFYDGNRAEDGSIHLSFDNPIQRQIMHNVASSRGYQVINTN